MRGPIGERGETGDKGDTGLQGPTGETGPPSFPDAPAGSTYGRLNASWVQVLPLSGGTVYGGLTIAGLALFATDARAMGALSLDNDPTQDDHAVTKRYTDALVPDLDPYLRMDGGRMTGALLLAADPADDTEAVTKRYADALVPDIDFSPYIRKDGGVMTGPFITSYGADVTKVGLGIGDESTGFFRVGTTLVLSVNGALTMQFLATATAMITVPLSMALQKITSLADATAAGDALNVRTADARYLQLVAGGIVQGALQLAHIPVALTDAATKQYVDGAIAASPNALRTFAFTPNEFTINAPTAATIFLDVNVTLPGGLRNVLISIDPIFASPDPPGLPTQWEIYYSTDLILIESPVYVYKIAANPPTAMFRAPVKLTAAVDATSGVVRVTLRVRCPSPSAAPLIQVGAGGTIAPNMRTIVTVQDLGPV